MNAHPLRRAHRAARILAACACLWATAAVGAWEPTAPVELIVPAGPGGGADQMARFIQAAVVKHKLMKQPLEVVNRAGQSGGDGLLAIKAAQGNPHKLVITLSNLFTAPLAHSLPFNWRDLTPVQMLALDQFVIWVSASSPYKTPQDLLEALRSSPPGTFKLGGTGSKQEDQIISVLLETAASTRISYLALRGGGDVANALAGGQVDLTVNNPIEAQGLWREGKVRPLCVLDGARLAYPEKFAGSMGWSDLPTCMSIGVPVQYLMLRGIFLPGGVTAEQVAYYARVLDQVRALPEWKTLMTQGAFKQTTLTGEAFVDWLDRTQSFHKLLMREARFMPGQQPAKPVAAATTAAQAAPAAAPKR